MRLALSKELGVSKTTVSNWELGQNEPSIDFLMRLAELAEGEMRDYFLAQARKKSGLSSDAMKSIADMDQRSSNRQAIVKADHFVRIPLHSGVAGAGSPFIHEHEDKEGYLSVPKEVCRHPNVTACLRIKGKSMEPTLLEGTIVAVDSSQKRIDKLIGKIVAARLDYEGVVVKRLVRIEERYVLASDSPGYDPLRLEKGWKIIGQVVWWIQSAEGY